MLTVHLKEDNPLPEGLVEEMHKAAHEESNRDWRDWLRGARWAIRRLLEDRKDAARYRWLQEHTVAAGLGRFMQQHRTQFLAEAVDAAMKAEHAREDLMSVERGRKVGDLTREIRKQQGRQ